MGKLMILSCILFLCNCKSNPKNIQDDMPGFELIKMDFSTKSNKVSSKIYQDKLNRDKFFFLYYWDNGLLMNSGFMFKDMKDSIWRSYYMNGKISSIQQYYKGKANGQHDSFNEDGKLIERKTYVFDTLIKVQIF